MRNSVANDSNPAAVSPWRDLVGWIVLGWVVAWSAIYFQSAVLHRFPGLLDWIYAGNG
jgi:hypothetical protein